MKPETGDRRLETGVPWYRGTVVRALGLSIFLGLRSPVSGFSQCPDGSPPPCAGARGPASNTVAVLPFDNLSRDTADAYLARDLTEEITTRLIKVERLTVTSPTVVRRYRGSDDPRAVAQALRVAYLVSGSVRRDRDRLRISVELLRARDGVAPWTDVFDRRDSSLLDIQIQIAQAVASAITGRLLPQEQQRLAARPTRDPRAYDHFARGKYLQGQRTTRSLLRAIQEYDAAWRLDSTIVAALAYQSTAYEMLAFNYYDAALIGQPRDSLRARAAALVARAWRADSNNATAVAVAAFHAADPTTRRALLERALVLDPHNPDILGSYAGALAAAGDSVAAEAMALRAISEDPTHTTTLLSLGMHVLRARRYAEAQRWLDSAVTFQPEAYFFFYDRALARLHTGDTAVVAGDIAEIRHAGRPIAAEALQLLLSVARRDTAAVRSGVVTLRAAVPTLVCEQNFDCLQAALAFAAAGEREPALALLERNRPRTGWMWDWMVMAEFDPMRDDPGFRQILDVVRPPWSR